MRSRRTRRLLALALALTWLAALPLVVLTVGWLADWQPTDPLWWVAGIILFGGGWCTWSLLYDTVRRRIRQRPTITPRRGT